MPLEQRHPDRAELKQPYLLQKAERGGRGGSPLARALGLHYSFRAQERDQLCPHRLCPLL